MPALGPTQTALPVCRPFAGNAKRAGCGRPSLAFGSLWVWS